MSSALDHLGRRLTELDAEGRRRAPSTLPAGTIVWCSNDYLGYAASPLRPTAAAAGSGASRLISGDDPHHREAELSLASWVGAEAALIFSSGYAANVGLLSALAEAGDLILSDALNHASIIDGCRLSRAEVAIVPHRDLSALERHLETARDRRCWVVTESYFSMDGQSPDLRALRALCDAYGAGLIVDEAHALGVFGPEGRGLAADAGVRPDVLVGTLGKAVGLQGAFVAGPARLRDWLWNRARSFVFSTGPSPAVTAALPERVGAVRRHDDLRARLRQASDDLRDALRTRGAEIPGDNHGPVVPWILGAEGVAMAASRALLERGLFVQAIRPPTVPVGTSRLRFTVCAAPGDATSPPGGCPVAARITDLVAAIDDIPSVVVTPR
ncbi:MAG: 8-amino-7-oxononanoate synthase [Myxococcota bacterium]